MIGSFIMGVIFVLLCLTVVFLLGKCRAHAADNQMIRVTNTDLLKRNEFLQQQLTQALDREQRWTSQPIQVMLGPDSAKIIASSIAPFIAAASGRVQ